jgi:hypothetical protein
MKSKAWHQSWEGNAAMFVISLGLSYGFISLALDSAKTLDYAVGIFFLAWAVRSLIRTIKLVRFHG